GLDVVPGLDEELDVAVAGDADGDAARGVAGRGGRGRVAAGGEQLDVVVIVGRARDCSGGLDAGRFLEKVNELANEEFRAAGVEHQCSRALQDLLYSDLLIKGVLLIALVQLLNIRGGRLP